MRPVKFLSIVAPLLGPFVAPLNAQTPQANIAGSWAFWLETGQVANAAFGLGATHPDFIPDQQLNVFYSHFAPGGIHFNATNTASEDLRLAALAAILKMAGMWAAGVKFASRRRFLHREGNYGLAGGVGPTNAASFGVRQ